MVTLVSLFEATRDSLGGERGASTTASAREDLRDGGKGDRGREKRSALTSEQASAGFSDDASRRTKMAKRKRSSEIRLHPRTSSKAKRDAMEAENKQRLDKLPREVYEKILGHLDENDLFPLALSCRYFRQKQVELVAPTRQGGPESEEPRLALRTSLKRKLDDGQPASAEYLRFCSMEEGVNGVSDERALHIRCLAAFHGYLPLLQELLSAAPKLNPEITRAAGKSSFSQSRLLLVWILTSFSSS